MSTKNKNILTTMNFNIKSVKNLTTGQIKVLKRKTSAFLKAAKWKPGTRMTVEIPWDLICIDEYQARRVIKAEDENEIDLLIAEWDDNKDIPCLINYRTDGQYAGLLFLYDGYHRARAKERMAADNGFKGVWSIIRSVSTDTEKILFADQDERNVAVGIDIKYDAWLSSDNDENMNVLAAKTVRNALSKYSVDAIAYKSYKGFCKLGLTQALKIAKRSIINNHPLEFDWILSILISSGFALQKRGLAADTLMILDGIYEMFIRGDFDDPTAKATSVGIANILTTALHGITWDRLLLEGSFTIDETAETVASTDRRSVVKKYLVDFIRKNLNKPVYGVYNDLDDQHRPIDMNPNSKNK